MRKTTLPGLFIFLLLLPVSGWGRDLRIYYTSNRQGEIDPCGCPGLVQNGGLSRMASALAAQGYNPKADLFLDAGDTFFSRNALLPARRQEESGRADVISHAYRLLRVDALSPGERDFAGGVENLKVLQTASGVQFVSANLTDPQGQLLFPPTVVIEKQGMKIGLTGLADPTAFEGVADVRVLPPGSALAGAIGLLKQKHVDVIVLLSHSGLRRDREIAKEGGIDLIVGAHSLDALDPPEQVESTRIVQPMYQGQQIGYLDLDGASHHWKQAHLIDLGRQWDRPNAVAQMVKEFKSGRKRTLGGGERETNRRKEKGAFVGHPAECRRCHVKQHDFWETTKHASAYLALYAKDEHFDPECIGCHSLGFQEKGGFSNIASPIVLKEAPKRGKGELPFIERLMQGVFAEDGERRPLDSRTEPARFLTLKKRYHDEIHRLESEGKIESLYAGVQCEHCHGNLAGHPENRRRIKKVVEATCRGCHRPPQVTDFNFAMIKQVACPSSGK